ncbi:MAG: glycosyltransferase family 4 protein [Patescibacteria group bacterium]
MIHSLLFITQKIHSKDDDLAFVILWIREFIRQGIEVRVICLERGDFDDSFPVYSLGKEKGYGTVRRAARFLRFIFTLKYDTVFVHMNPEYFTLGGWYWWIKRTPSYLWYTHYKMHVHLRLAAFFSKRMFAATAQSLPQYNKSPKKVIVGHGIDIGYWISGREGGAPQNPNPCAFVSIHRICRSKRAEIGIAALKYLPENYTLTIYGRDVEKDYAEELCALVKKEQLEKRMRFVGSVPMGELRAVYPQYRVMVNMASETIDKTMLEGMLFGVYPVTTKGNSKAIGLPVWPEDDKPETVARFILDGAWQRYDASFLRRIVIERHSLSALVEKMAKYIKRGI